MIMPSITINLSGTTFVSSEQPDMNLSYFPLLLTGTDSSFGTCERDASAYRSRQERFTQQPCCSEPG